MSDPSENRTDTIVLNNTTFFDKRSTLLESREEQQNSESCLEYLTGKNKDQMIWVVTMSDQSCS